jgi:CubicO group peptidase (beta-lactamase class C family)
VVYVSELGRYLLATAAGDMKGSSRLTLLDSSAPWGPWTLVGTIAPWGSGRDGDHRYDPRLPQAWIRDGGLELVLVYSDRRQSDKLNHQSLRLARAQAPAAFEWEPGDPASSGFDGTRLNALRDDLMRRGTRALLVARADRVVLEAYAPGFGPRSLFGTASLAKSIVGGVALLLALQDGLVSLDDPASRFIPAWSDDPLRSRITLRHLATHSSGLEDTPGPRATDSLTGSWKREFWQRDANPFRIARDQVPVLFEPGTRFLYSNPGVAALDLCVATALHRKGGADLAELLRSRVFDPIGLPSGDWSISYGRAWELDGIPLRATWGGARFTARATARLGRLFLREGDWQGLKILSPEWVRAAPGLLWRSNRELALPSLPPDAFLGVGADHQVLLVVPSLELVVVRYGATVLDEPGGDLEFWGALEGELFAPLAASLRAAPHRGA